MPKSAVTEWDTTAANNTDVGGIGIQGTNAISNFDDAVREIMAQIATFVTGATYTGTFLLTSTDAGAAVDPKLYLYRNSASPANNDQIGFVAFDGNDSGGNRTTYADMFVTITDVTNGSEDASLAIRNMVAGTLTNAATVTATGWNEMNIGATTPGTASFTTLSTNGVVNFNSTNTVGPVVTSTDAGATVGPTFTLFRDSASPAVNDALGYFACNGRNSAAASKAYFDFFAMATNVTSTTEAGKATFRVMSAGTITNVMELTTTGINSAAIGATTASTGRFTTCTATTTFNLPSYTVAGLPAAGTAGRMAWASNLRVFNGTGTQEGAGLGTGGLVTDNGTAWKIAGTNVTAVA